MQTAMLQTCQPRAAVKPAQTSQRKRSVVVCHARQQSSHNAAAAAAAAVLVAVSAPAFAAPTYDVADVTGTEQSDRRKLGPNEVDTKDLESFPNASKKDAESPPIVEVAKPGPKQAPKPVPDVTKSGRAGSSATSGSPKGGKQGGGGGDGASALVGSAGPKDSNKALDGFFSRLRGGK